MVLVRILVSVSITAASCESLSPNLSTREAVGSVAVITSAAAADARVAAVRAVLEEIGQARKTGIIILLSCVLPKPRSPKSTNLPLPPPKACRIFPRGQEGSREAASQLAEDQGGHLEQDARETGCVLRVHDEDDSQNNEPRNRDLQMFGFRGSFTGSGRGMRDLDSSIQGTSSVLALQNVTWHGQRSLGAFWLSTELGRDM